MSEEKLGSEGPDGESSSGQNVYQELAELVDEERIESKSRQRLAVVEGLTEVTSGRIGIEDKYRFMVTAAVQAAPRELGSWLLGEGEGFKCADRPVNTSIIDQDHN